MEVGTDHFTRGLKYDKDALHVNTLFGDEALGLVLRWVKKKLDPILNINLANILADKNKDPILTMINHFLMMS